MTKAIMYLTPDQVEGMHRSEVIAHGGSEGVNRGRLEAAVCRCRQSAFGEDAFHTIHLKAAALLTGIACGHAFVDGNKRTAVVATDVFYMLNGYVLQVESGDMIDLVIDAVEHIVDLEKVADRLERWAAQIDVDDLPNE